MAVALVAVEGRVFADPARPSRPRVVVTSDIGGTDPDDYQSMAHLLLYADTLEIEGLVSSPFEREGKDKILEVIDAYARDFPNLRTWSAAYPEPDALRALTKQGGVKPAPYSGLRGATEGSDWIVRRARRDDPRPLHVLVWGALEELAQALHDAPDILPRLRVYYIGGPNKKWGPDAYQYLVDHFPSLWIIEANSTYRGYFLGGDQSGEWGNQSFVASHIAGRGALGDYFAQHLGGVIKMGDTPSVNWLLHGDPADPASPGWGGRFVRAWDRPQARFDRLTIAADHVEIFSIVELSLPIPAGAKIVGPPEARLTMGNQTIAAHDDGAGRLRVRFCPRDPKVFAYSIASNVPGLDGATGEITSVLPAPEIASRPSARFPNWWTDDPSPSEAEGVHHGARGVSRWREDYLRDFAARMDRCARPAPAAASRLKWGAGLLKRDAAWYASPEARAAADSVLLYQSPEGAWPKNSDLLVAPTPGLLAEIEKKGETNTLDNHATTRPMRFLALVAQAGGEEKYRAAVLRGVDYLLAAQYPNGGFPQFYPLRDHGYYSRITYNDGAMIDALELLRDIAAGQEPFAFVDSGRRARCADAVARGIDCILKTQIVQETKPTAWCAQHDEKTLAPAWARKFEPPSLSGDESVDIVRFLMRIENPSPEVVAAVDGAVAWLRAVVIHGQRLERIKGDDGRVERRLVADPSAPPLWARFYELGTDRPLYMDRDSRPVYTYAEIDYERRSGYDYHGEWAAGLLAKDYPAWRARIAKSP